MKKRVLITGVGTLSAAGHGVDALHEALRCGEPLFEDVVRFNGFKPGTRKAGHVEDFKPRDWMTGIRARQTDLGTQFALAAFQMCLDDARLDVAELDPLRVGIMLGNAIGGMDFGECQLYNRKFFGPKRVNVYQAIAWFYAAAVGQISIAHGIKGYSKAFAADRVSSLHALGHAYRVVQEGRLDVCLAGGAEAPIVPYVYQAIEASGRVSQSDYLPFDRQASGFLLGEGAAFLALEEASHALERGATVYGEVSGFALTTDPDVDRYELSGAGDLERALAATVTEAGASAIDLVVADGAAQPKDDTTEVEALEAVCGESWQGLRVTAPKAIVGELYGAGSAIQAAAGALALRHQENFPLARGGGSAPQVPHASSWESEFPVDHVLIASRGNGGMNASLGLAGYKN